MTVQAPGQQVTGSQVAPSEMEHDEVAIERSRYTRALSMQLKKLYDDAKAKGQPIPVDISENLEELSLSPLTSKQTLPRTVIHKVYPPSRASIEDLQLTSIDKLQSHTIHRGKYLLLYTVSPVMDHEQVSGRKQRTANTYALVPVYDKDHARKKTGAFLELHNCFVRKPLEEILPQGTTIRVREPFYSLCTATSSEKLVIRVDHPTDIEILYPFAVDKDEAHWKRLGDSAFGLQRFHEAAAWYTKGISLSRTGAPDANGGDEPSMNIRSNRAAALLELGQYDNCIKECDTILNKEANFKAMYRRAKAYYHLDRRTVQLDSFLRSCQSDTEPQSDAVDGLVQDILDRAAEASGLFNWSDLQREAYEDDYLDRANFQSAAIAVEKMKGKGNGVVAKKDIKAGTLLVVSKASAIVYEHDKSAISSIRIDTVYDRCDRGEQNELAPLLTQHVCDNPSRRRGIYELFAGPDFETAIDKDDNSIDAFRMYGVQVHNSFETEATEIQLSALPSRKSLRRHKLSTGIWRLPSYFNHSCLNNCTRLFLRDILIIKACRDIKAGEELTLGYVNKLHDAYERQACCHDFGFVCQCALCKLDRDEISNFPVEVIRREELEEEYQTSVVAAMLKGCLSVAEMRRMKEVTARLVFKLRSSYEKTGRAEMRYGLLRPLNALCTISIQLMDWQFAMTAAKLMSDLSPPDHGIDDLYLGLQILIVAIQLKFCTNPPNAKNAQLDEALNNVVAAWKVRGLVMGFGGFWDEFGDWFAYFFSFGRDKDRDEAIRLCILRAFLTVPK